MINADLVFFDAGGGHRAAAEALRLVMEEQGGWNVRLVNLQELLDPIDLARKLTGLRMQDLYNLMLKKGWTLGHPADRARAASFSSACCTPRQVRLLEEFWRSSQRGPGGLGGSPFQPRPRRKPAPGAARHALCHHPDGHRRLPAAFLDRAPGAVLHLRVGPCRGAGARPGHPRQPDFSSLGHDPAPALLSASSCDRREERKQRGLDPDLPTGLVLFGGQGSDAMLEIAERLDAEGPHHLQLIFICGRNQSWRTPCAGAAAACGPSWKALPPKFPSTCSSPISLSASPGPEA